MSDLGVQWLQVYRIDCRKVEEYQGSPEAAAELLGSLLNVGDALQVGPVCLGHIRRVAVEGPILRIYVKIEDSIELGSAISGGL